MLEQPAQPAIEYRTVFIRCFTCGKDHKVRLKEIDGKNRIACPDCNGKEILVLNGY